MQQLPLLAGNSPPEMHRMYLWVCYMTRTVRELRLKGAEMCGMG
jgi:hypothetical protein